MYLIAHRPKSRYTGAVPPRVLPPNLRCPICGRSDIRFSGQREVWDIFQKIFNRAPFRCLSCQARFYNSLNPAPPKEEEPKEEPNED